MKALRSMIGVLLFCSSGALHAQGESVGLTVSGRHLLTPCGDTLILRGVNKMSIWTDDLDLRKITYAEIKQSGANCVRIVWLAQPGPFEQDAGPEGLDRNIQDAIDAGLIPMVELHDATGDLSRLPIIVQYWTRPEVVDVINKHKRYLLVNIANEAGDETVTDQQFIDVYSNAVSTLREAGISTPLVIDASDWGKNLEQLVRVGSPLQAADPDHNLLFSAHLYWALSDGADADFIRSQFAQAIGAGLPFIIGEFTHYFNRGGGCTYETDYEAIIRYCDEFDIGWLAWEWGPGNEFADPTCEVMNMTSNSMYATLKDTWAKVVVEASDYGIKQTSVTHYFTAHKGECDPTSVMEAVRLRGDILITPNPSPGRPTLHLMLTWGERVSVKIYDPGGTVMYASEVTGTTDGLASIPLPISTSGLYICVVHRRDTVLSAPFIIVE